MEIRSTLTLKSLVKKSKFDLMLLYYDYYKMVHGKDYPGVLNTGALRAYDIARMILDLADKLPVESEH
jgi:hypothetical protein